MTYDRTLRSPRMIGEMDLGRASLNTSDASSAGLVAFDIGHSDADLLGSTSLRIGRCSSATLL
jgi:hypothetical protein